MSGYSNSSYSIAGQKAQHEEETQRCAQCGREGTRGFVTIPAAKVVDPVDGVTTVVIPEMTLCKSTTACRKRWPERGYAD